MYSTVHLIHVLVHTEICQQMCTSTLYIYIHVQYMYVSCLHSTWYATVILYAKNQWRRCIPLYTLDLQCTPCYWSTNLQSEQTVQRISTPLHMNPARPWTNIKGSWYCTLQVACAVTTPDGCWRIELVVASLHIELLPRLLLMETSQATCKV